MGMAVRIHVIRRRGASGQSVEGFAKLCACDVPAIVAGDGLQNEAQLAQELVPDATPAAGTRTLLLAAQSLQQVSMI